MYSRLNTISTQPNILLLHINYVTHVKEVRVACQLKIWELQSMIKKKQGMGWVHEMRCLLYCQVNNSIVPTSHIKFPVFKHPPALPHTHTTPDLPFRFLNLGKFVFQNGAKNFRFLYICFVKAE